MDRVLTPQSRSRPATAEPRVKKKAGSSSLGPYPASHSLHEPLEMCADRERIGLPRKQPLRGGEIR